MYVHQNSGEAIRNRGSYQERDGATLRCMIVRNRGTEECSTVVWKLQETGDQCIESLHDN